MGELISHRRRQRKSFEKIPQIVELPGLIDVQRRSFEEFLQEGIPSAKRQNVGLEAVFRSVFPIESFEGTASLEYENYILETPKYDVGECRDRGMTYASPLRVTVRLLVWDVDETTGAKTIRDVKEQEVYLGEVPLMTETGSFIINGNERVIVSQLHRSPGVFFSHDKGSTHASGKLLYSARVIPYRGSWIDIEFNHKDLIFVRIDRRRKMPATALLKALGYSTQDLIKYYYQSETLYLAEDSYSKSIEWNLLKGQRSTFEIKHPKTKKVLVKKNRRFTERALEEMKSAGLKEIPIDIEEVVKKICYEDIIDKKTGEVLLSCNQKLTRSMLKDLQKKGVKEIKILFADDLNRGAYISETLASDKVESTEEALIEIYRRLRPGDPPTLEAAKNLFENLFFNPSRYDLSRVGRLKLNHKFKLDIPIETTVLTKKDILETLRYLVELKDGRGKIDDIDHLGNRRVRSVGELIENQFRIGLVRMERGIRERMSLQEVETLMPHDLVNSKPIQAVMKEFFGSSQLSQFMDQVNPLAEITHKRRLSALGPGGLTRERAGFEVRDVHSTHYGRICPIETPEGPNIGLISSLSTHARVNPYGFIETPYRKVVGKKVTDDIEYYSALNEEDHVIAQANAQVKGGKLVSDYVTSRKAGEFIITGAQDVDLMDVSPNQLVSVAAALIPFLEHDDANRALMGSNMQRQAVPLLKPRSPLIGTGMEKKVASDSGVTLRAKRDGVVESVDASRIVVKAKTKASDADIGVDIYKLDKFRRSNQGTCVNQKPIVKEGDKIQKGEVIADGAATHLGELALGQNITVAFMPWEGYNFEDSILVSEKLLKQDIYTSVHIEEFECVARDTKLGREEITRDIPNVGETALADLDDSGIIRIGAEVKPGDILVGKITPKGETQLSPEEKLLRAIFGEKARDVRDTSLRVSPGIAGTIIHAQVFSREGIEKDERAKIIQDEEVSRLMKDRDSETQIIKSAAKEKLEKDLVGARVTGKVLSLDGKETLLSKGKTLTQEVYDNLPFDLLQHLPLSQNLEEKISKTIEGAVQQIELVKSVFQEKMKKLKQGDELSPGVIKMVKVYVAMKRRLAVGDKMAGRHGNKGVVSRILPEEDMPYMEDGTPVDVVLNPLGVPSRMNLGQILETHLGWASKELGNKVGEFVNNFEAHALKKLLKSIYSSQEIDGYLEKASTEELRNIARYLKDGVPMATPVFNGATENEIRAALLQAGLPSTAQTTLYDGRTGEAVAQDVTVGAMYFLKLHHLVEDKIHARSIGPYSLVTQQPLGGKAQFGGQRLGEMEVWAMEAYGAAYALQEFLTVKADDVAGRTRMYEAIVKGENVLEPGLPESFNVLTKELQSLCLDVELQEEEIKP
ncbi:MAG: DNA-directed RNA polymerase subunit beta [Deltaproteobacteria bacterium]|nr:DNA-directed RNA polymerase subunit beta [Deltaproteobacteria bacterium]